MSKRHSISNFLRNRKAKKEDSPVSFVENSNEPEETPLFNQFLQCLSSVPFPSMEPTVPLYISLSFTKLMISKPNPNANRRTSSNLEQLIQWYGSMQDFLPLREEAWTNLHSINILHTPSLDVEFGITDLVAEAKRLKKLKRERKNELKREAKRLFRREGRKGSTEKQTPPKEQHSPNRPPSLQRSASESRMGYSNDNSGYIMNHSFSSNSFSQSPGVMNGYTTESSSGSGSSSNSISESFDSAHPSSYSGSQSFNTHSYPEHSASFNGLVAITSGSESYNDSDYSGSYSANSSPYPNTMENFRSTSSASSTPLQSRLPSEDIFNYPKSSPIKTFNSDNTSETVKAAMKTKLSVLEQELRSTYVLEKWKKKWKKFIRPNDYALALEFRQIDTSKKGGTTQNVRQYMLKTHDCRLFIETTAMISILWKASLSRREVDDNTLILKEILEHEVTSDRSEKKKKSSEEQNSKEFQALRAIEDALLKLNHTHVHNALLFLRVTITSIIRRRDEIKDYKRHIEVEITKRMRQIEQESTQWMRDSSNSHVYSFLELTLIFCSKLLEQNDNTLQYLIGAGARCISAPSDVPPINQFRKRFSDSLTKTKIYKETQKDINDLSEAIKECAMNLSKHIKVFSNKIKEKIEEERKVLEEELRQLESSFQEVIAEETNWLKTDFNLSNGSLISTSEDLLSKDPTPMHLKVHKQRLLNRITRIDNQSANLHLKKDILENYFDKFNFEKLMCSHYIEPQNHIFCLDDEHMEKLLEKKLVRNKAYLHSQVFLQQAYMQRIFLLNENVNHLKDKLRKLIMEYKKELESRHKDKTLLERELQFCEEEIIKDHISHERRLLHGRYIDLCRVRLDIVKVRIQISARYCSFFEEELSRVKDKLAEQHLSVLLEIQKSLDCHGHQALPLKIVDSCSHYEKYTFQEIVNTLIHRIDIEDQIVTWKEELTNLKTLLSQLRSRNINALDSSDQSESLISKSLSQEYIHSEKESMMQDIVLQKVASQWHFEKSPASECWEIFRNNIRNRAKDSSQLYTIENTQFVIQHIADLLCSQYPDLQEYVEYSKVVSMIEGHIFDDKSIYDEAIQFAACEDEDIQFLKNCEAYRNFVLNNVMGDELQFKILSSKNSASADEIIEFIRKTFSQGIHTLQSICNYNSPSEKLKQITCAAKSVINSLGSMKELKGDGIGADDFLPIFIIIVLISQISRLGTEIKFIEQFGNEDILINEYGYFFTSLQSAKHYITQIIEQMEETNEH